MKLTEIESPTELIKKAIEDDIVTVEQYELWLIGYMSGARDTQNDALNSIAEIERDEDIRLTAEDIKYEMASQRAGEIL